MAHRLITSVRRADRILKSGLFTGNFNVLAQQNCLGLVQFNSQMSAHSPFNGTKGLGNPTGPKAGNTSEAFPAGGIGSDPNFSAFSGSGDGREGDEEKSSGGPRFGGMSYKQILVTIFSATILGVSLQDVNSDDEKKWTFDSGVLPELVQLLDHPEVMVQKAAVRAISNTFRATEDQAQAVLNCTALSYLYNLLNDPKKEMSRDVLWLLSNVTGHNSSQVQAVRDAGLIPLIIRHLEKGEFKIQKEAAWAVSSMTGSGDKEQVAYFIDCGVIPPLCNLLNCKDSEVIQVVLRGIQSILKIFANQDGGHKVCTLIKECGGVDKIESLQNHENKEIRKRAHDILENYFSGDVGKDGLAPEAPETAFQSGPTQLT